VRSRERRWYVLCYACAQNLERERVLIFLAAAALLSLSLPFFFVSSLFFSLVSSSFSSFWRRTNAAPQTTPRSREKKEGEVRKRVLLPLWYYVRTAPITPFSLSLSLSFSQSLSENLVFAFAVKSSTHRGEKKLALWGKARGKNSLLDSE